MSYFPDSFDCFDEPMAKEFQKNKQGVVEFLQQKKLEFPEPTKFKVYIYKMNQDMVYDYNALLESFSMFSL